MSRKTTWRTSTHQASQIQLGAKSEAAFARITLSMELTYKTPIKNVTVIRSSPTLVFKKRIYSNAAGKNNDLRNHAMFILSHSLKSDIVKFRVRIRLRRFNFEWAHHRRMLNMPHLFVWLSNTQHVFYSRTCNSSNKLSNDINTNACEVSKFLHSHT